MIYVIKENLKYFGNKIVSMKNEEYNCGFNMGHSKETKRKIQKKIRY